MVLGEGQIMSQVKSAHQAALRAGSAGSVLDALFKSALTCGKKVRTQTGLSRRAVSISSAAVELTRKLMGGLESRSVLVVGAGRMGQICVKLLLSENENCNIYVTNRNQNKIKAMQEANVRNLDRLIIADFEERHHIAAKCNAVIVATSAHNFVINKEEMFEAKESLPQELAKKDLHVVDMSVPRNVDPEISLIPNIAVYNCDSLEQIVKDNLAEREALTKDAEIIIFACLREFEHWQHTLFVAPVIAELRGKVEDIRQSYLRHSAGANVSVELSQNQEKTSNREQERASKQLDKVSRVIVNQILHKPTTRLKAVRDYRSLHQQIEALQSLFDLSPLAKTTYVKVKTPKSSS